MKPTSTLAVVTAFTLATGAAIAGVAPMPAPVTPAPAPIGGPYLDISGGALWLGDIGDISFDTGWGVNAEIGYALGNGLSFGFNAGYYAADIDISSIHVPGAGTISSSGEVETVPFMATCNYTFPISGILSGYIGGGAGVLWNSGDADIKFRGETIAEITEDDWNFALQGRAGLSFAVSSNAAINVGYRYIHSFFSGDDFSGNMVEGGFTLRF